jgi:hypothetical protein
VELVNGEWVDIPVEDIEHGYIISFDATVNITHDKSEIHKLTGLSVNATPNPIQTGETSDITAQLIDYNGEVYNLTDGVGTIVYFYEVLTPTFNITATQDIIQSGGTTDVNCKVKDADGSIAVNKKIYFYKKEEI